ncbi:MAG TPA: hypothetical protein VF731_07410 [Solirubrobacterales bacterium]
MASYTFNIMKGRIVELYKQTKAGNPAASGFILIPLAVGDIEANRQDDDDVATFLAAAPNEAGASWGRKPLQAAALAALPAPDDGNNRYAVPLPQVTWTTPTAGQNTVGLLVAYAADVAGADATLIPCTYHDFAVTADGNDVILNAGDFFRAS